MKPIDNYFEGKTCPFCAETTGRQYSCKLVPEDEACGNVPCTELDQFNCPLAEQESGQRYLEVSGAGNYVAGQRR